MSGLFGASLALAGGLVLSCSPADDAVDRTGAISTTTPVTGDDKPPVNRIDGGRPGKLDPAVANVPTSVTVLGTKAPIDPVTTISNGELQLPTTTRVIAWWAGGAMPGEKTGVISLAGHLNTKTEKSGLFTRLAQLRKGDKVSVATYGGKTYTYKVSMAPKHYDKSGLPKNLFDPAAKHQLALITCSGTWDPETRAYPNNLVVWATPA